MEIFSTVLGSLGIAGVIGIGIWVGAIQTKVSTVERFSDKIEKMSDKIDRLTEDVSFIKGTLSKQF